MTKSLHEFRADFIELQCGTDNFSTNPFRSLAFSLAPTRYFLDTQLAI